MAFRFSSLLLILLFAACTYTPDSSFLNGELHPPLVYQPWDLQHYDLNNGTKACGLSSGYNGITMVISQSGEVAAKSNREVQPGTTFSVSANGGVYETQGEFFPEKTAKSIAEHFLQGGKGYVEWREYSGPTASPVRIQNVVRLDNFKSQWQQCKDSLNIKG